MKKRFLILLLVLLSGCIEVVDEIYEGELDELQIIACEEADGNGACETRLIEVGIVMPNECCEALRMCCGYE